MSITIRSLAWLAVCALPFARPSSSQEVRDGFYFLDRMNRASAVTLREGGAITPEQASNIARSIDELYRRSSAPGFRRSSSYLSVEPSLLEIGGDEVSRLHSGRSSIDTGRTNLRLLQRELILEAYEALIESRRAMLDFGAEHRDAVIPAYTLGVQAQPTTLGHYVTGYVGVMERHAELLRQTYDNVNRSPLGAAVLGTSSYPIDRQRLSDLLGFDAPIHNSFDAVQLATLEANARIGGATTAIALTAGELMGDLAAQYRFVKPWITFPPEMTGGSSIMPQKLNPSGINSARTQASAVLGHAVSYLFAAHKSTSGDTDLIVSGPDEALRGTTDLLEGIAEMFGAFQFDEQRALEESLDDWGTATELANTLQRVGGVPFRDAHHIAAMVVQFGRERGLRPTEVGFEDFERVFAEGAREIGMTAARSGLTPDQFRRALTPQNMVTSSLGFGGPQASEVSAMYQASRDALAVDKAWLDATRSELGAASARLDEAFATLLR